MDELVKYLNNIVFSLPQFSINQAQRDQYQSQTNQGQRKLPVTLFGGKFYQGGEGRSQGSGGRSRGGRGTGKGWGIIKKTFFTPLGRPEPLKANKTKKKSWQMQQVNEDDPATYSVENADSKEVEEAATDQPGDEACPPAPPSYHQDYPEQHLQSSSTGMRNYSTPSTPARYPDQHGGGVYSPHDQHHTRPQSHTSQYRDYHHLPRELRRIYCDRSQSYPDLLKDYQETPQSYPDELQNY